ncbi:MAG TPA: cytochrome P450 [Candidatus Eisenbacteria bacterium]|nr:cytochrome P450 [Candidatus Eisenbacteria bacterium]
MTRDALPSTSRTAPPGVPRELVSRAARDPLAFLLRITREYGDVAQFPTAFGPLYLVNHPEYVRAVLHSSTSVRVSMLKMGLGEGLLTSEGSYWRSQRRRMQPAFHQQCMESFASIISDTTKELLQQWEPAADSGDVIDVAAEMNRLTLRIIGKALFGVDFAPVAEKLSTAITTMLAHLKQLSFFAPSNTISGSRQRLFQKGMKTIDDVVYGIIAERRKGEERRDFLGLLLDADGAQNVLSDRQVRDEVVTMFIAGHETTANMLAWTWYLLARHPEVERRLYREIDGLLAGRMPGFQDVPKLPYTKMVIQESMRIYPPVVLLYRKVFADREFGGFFIPSGSTIAVSPYTTHRHPDFWEDAERFDPERFTPERHANRPHYAYFPFGGGPHLCMGNVFAMMEGAVILSAIAARYSLRLEPGEPVEPDPFITLRLRSGLRMSLERR